MRVSIITAMRLVLTKVISVEVATNDLNNAPNTYIIKIQNIIRSEVNSIILLSIARIAETDDGVKITMPQQENFRKFARVLN